MKQSTAIALLGGAAVAVVAVVGLIFLWPGQNQQPQGAPPLPANARTFGNWALTCGNDQQGVKRCALLMRVLDNDTRRMVLSINLTRGPRGNPIFVVVTPPSVVNTAGVTIQPAMGEAATGQFQSCTPQRCLSIIVLTEALAKSIAASQNMNVQYVAGNGRPVRYPLPTNGFAQGLMAWQTEFPAPPPTSPAPGAAPAAAPAPAAAEPGRAGAAPAPAPAQ
jgi:invasion protein IalB